MRPGRKAPEDVARFGNALRQLERRRKLKSEATADLLDAFDTLGPQSDAAPAGQRRLLDLARQYDLSVYDASHLELAIRLTVPLATQDFGFAAAATKAGLMAG